MCASKQLQLLLSACLLFLSTAAQGGDMLTPSSTTVRCTGQLGILRRNGPNAPIACVSALGEYIPDASKAPPFDLKKSANEESCGEFIVESENRGRVVKITNISPRSDELGGKLYCGLLEDFRFSCLFTQPPVDYLMKWQIANKRVFPGLACLRDARNNHANFDINDDYESGPSTLFSDNAGKLAIVCLKDIPVNAQGLARWPGGKVKEEVES
ncbi:MAG: hypothetical protein M1829_003349 [Trizodia sp. TS-e1964]|nr:MAG: hypothetical protein M1829_003349 [Trizodia sp. TS-e1964]